MSNIKRITALILVLILIFSLSACASNKNQDRTESESTIETVEPTQADDTVKSYEKVCVDIANDDGGYYCMWADADISYDINGNINGIFLNDPALLAFQVSNIFEGGVGVMDGVDVEKVITILEKYIENSNVTDDAQIEDLYEVLEIMKDVPVITGAST